jgi:hypothetical protein
VEWGERAQNELDASTTKWMSFLEEKREKKKNWS